MGRVKREGKQLVTLAAFTDPLRDTSQLENKTVLTHNVSVARIIKICGGSERGNNAAPPTKEKGGRTQFPFQRQSVRNRSKSKQRVLHV